MTIILATVLILEALVLGPRVYKDYHKKKEFKNTFAIVNVQSGLALRPKGANYQDEIPLITYGLHNWECITWQLIEIDSTNTYLFKNLYTQKTFQPAVSPKEGVSLWQQTLGGSRLQYWQIIEKDKGRFLIRLKDTELYLTASSDTENAIVVLKPLGDTEAQLWKKLSQNPVI